ncbi:MAG: hypothetical protein L6U16_08500 [Porphyromonadaceae bacterium]|nr:MAG: hypothetical protein L6U16_08500 [Porphyromonadaceae bacterium]
MASSTLPSRPISASMLVEMFLSLRCRYLSAKGRTNKKEGDRNQNPCQELWHQSSSAKRHQCGSHCAERKTHEEEISRGQLKDEEKKIPTKNPHEPEVGLKIFNHDIKKFSCRLMFAF